MKLGDEVRQFDSQASQTLFTGVDAVPIALASTVALVVAYPISDGAITELDSLGLRAPTGRPTLSPTARATIARAQVAIQIELEDFNEVHITAVYADTPGTQADTLYVRGLTIKGTVLTESTPLTVSIEDTVSKQRYRPKTRDLAWHLAAVRLRHEHTSHDAPWRHWRNQNGGSAWTGTSAIGTSFWRWTCRTESPSRCPISCQTGLLRASAGFIPLDGVNPVCTLDVSLVEGTTAVTPPAPVGDSVTIPLTGATTSTNLIRWPDNQSLGSVFAADGSEQTMTFVTLYNAGPSGQVQLSIVGSNNRLTADFEASGLLTFEASDGEMLEVMIADADMSEPYTWTPTNSAEVVAFALHVKGLTDQDATLTLSD